MNEFLRIEVHEEFARRMEEEHTRQNHRIGILEKTVEQNNKLLVSVERLASNMEHMQKEMKEQGDRLEALEGRDGEMWRKVMGYVITAAISAVMGYIFSRLGM